MSENSLRQQLTEAQEIIRVMQNELAETNRGLVALMMELENRVDERTAELRTTQEELQKTNFALLQLTLELENRVVERTAQLQLKDEEVKAMSQQLWQAAKLATMGELAASIAHELNNPLTTISLRVESLLAQTLLSDPRRRVLEVVEQEVDRMGSLIANLLQFSRRSTKQITTLDLREEIAKTLELIHYHLRNHHIQVVQEIAPDIPKTNADRQQLQQVFLNLFTNASDAMPQGGTLTICAKVKDTPHNAPEDNPIGAPQKLLVEITDTGTGISSENLSKVGEPFFTTKPEGKGTGLGLAICRRIIQEYEGTLHITSEIGKGTTVRIELSTQVSGNEEFLKF
jgi:signal transduction histidine kinase